MTTVFLSYAHHDGTEVAEYLYGHISGAGYQVWQDSHSLPPGSQFPQEIAQNVADSDCMVVLLSDSSVQSDWVADEINFAMSSRRRIIPVRISDVQPPPLLMSRHYLDMLDPETRWRGLHNMVNSLEGGDVIPRIYSMQDHETPADRILVLGQFRPGFIDLSDPDIVSKMAVMLGDKALPFVLEAGAGIVLPGHGALAAAVIAYLSGLLSQLPVMYWAANQGDGFRLSGENNMDLQRIREFGQANRLQDK